MSVMRKTASGKPSDATAGASAPQTVDAKASCRCCKGTTKCVSMCAANKSGKNGNGKTPDAVCADSTADKHPCKPPASEYTFLECLGSCKQMGSGWDVPQSKQELFNAKGS